MEIRFVNLFKRFGREPGELSGVLGVFFGEWSVSFRGAVGEFSGSCRGVFGELSGNFRGLVGAARDQVSFYFSFMGPFGTTC